GLARRTAASPWRVTCALPAPGPIPAGCPTPPPPRSATAPANRSAPAPSAPARRTHCSDHRSPSATRIVPRCGATALPPTALARPTTRLLAEYLVPPRRQSAPLPRRPWPPP